MRKEPEKGARVGVPADMPQLISTLIHIMQICMAKCLVWACFPNFTASPPVGRCPFLPVVTAGHTSLV